MEFSQASLYKLGFSEKETAVYLALLKTGPAAASTLARLSKVKRTSIYDILNELLERNLIQQFKQGNVTYYVIDDVDRIEQHAKDQLRLSKAVTQALKKEQQKGQGIQVNYYKGVEGYRQMYEDILEAKPKELMGWIHLDYFYEALNPEREREWTQERIARGIFIRLLMQDTSLAREYQSKDEDSSRETRLLSKKNAFKTTCLLYEDFVIYFDSTKEVSGVRIHNPEIYNMQKQIFEMSWESI